MSYKIYFDRIDAELLKISLLQDAAVSLQLDIRGRQCRSVVFYRHRAIHHQPGIQENAYADRPKTAVLKRESVVAEFDTAAETVVEQEP